MLTTHLHPISSADEDEVEMYYKVEETMVENGDLKMSQEELYDEIDSHHSLYILKTHEHFHIFTLIVAALIYYIAYEQYLAFDGPSIFGIILTILGTLMLALSWVISNPTLKHETEVQDYYKSHRMLFLYDKDHSKVRELK
ncbi:putative membrane protein [Halobacteriovorax marinus SJ]|uniref:Membrane protein n=1 Tax=Halobacteriovorax marinus (strain ATCC BAA-682 / DSM 15412 / SJ) TaxID=862908 RepID=E1X4S6_HALMS|nr:hypothetical protein [Halobacteriovorax marinus]CBW27152.1 putative membrane protein [Halobacteriovorax marinus SJ]